MDILIKDIKVIYTVDDNNPVINNGYIIIKDNLINKIGEQVAGEYEWKEKEFDLVINGENKMMLPGLINTHTHAAMTLLRGYADDLPLKTWLEEKIWPVEANLTREDIYWGSMLAITEMIKTGTTTFTDMYFKMDSVADAVTKTGIRAVLSQGLIEANDGNEGLAAAEEFSREWNGKADGKITTMLGPHSPYTCSEKYLEKVITISEKLNIPINIHIAETKNEIKIIREKYNTSPVRYLHKIGLFDRPVLGAHCVYVDKNDIEILSNNYVGVAYNPKSNMKLGSGIAPIYDMLAAGVSVGLGTDGTSSNNNLDLISEARIGSYLQKVNRLDATALDIWQSLEILTKNGADILNLNNLGQLKEGYIADLILINLEKTHYYPHHNNLSNLLYAGTGQDVSTVIINGKPIMKDKKLLTIDEEEVYYEVEKRSKRIQ